MIKLQRRFLFAMGSAALLLGGTGCSLIFHNQPSACIDKSGLPPVNPVLDLSSIKASVLGRNSKKTSTYRATLIADYASRAVATRTRIDVSMVGDKRTNFARAKGSIQGSVPAFDLLIQNQNFTSVLYADKSVSSGSVPSHNSERAPGLQIAKTMMQYLDPEQALAQRFRDGNVVSVESTLKGHVLTVRTKENHVELWTLRLRDLLPIRVGITENGRQIGEVRYTGFQRADDGSGLVPTCMNAIVEPGLDLSLTVLDIKRDVTIPAEARRQSIPADFKRQSI